MSLDPPNRAWMLALGLATLALASFCAFDALRARPTDGAEWLLGRNEIRIVGLTTGGPAERAGLRAGDVIEAIDRMAIRNAGHAAAMLQAKEVGEEVSYLFRRGSEVREASLRLGSTRIAEPGIYLVYLVLGLLFFLAGLYVYLNNPRQLPSQLFFVLCLLFLVYFAAASERSSNYYWSEGLVRNMGALAALMVPPLFLHFFLVFPTPQPLLARRPWLAPLLYLLPLVFYAGFTWEQLRGGGMPQISALQQVALGCYFTAGLASLVSVFFTSPDPTQRQRVKFLTLGTVCGTLPFLVFNIALGKLLGRSDLALLGAVPMVLVPVSFGYSIARYRLMDIEVIIRRSLVYAVLTGMLVAAYMVIVVVVGRLVLQLSGQSSQLVAIVATLIVAAFFAPMRERVQGFLERRFFREKHDLQQALHDLSKAIPHTLDREALVSLVQHRVTALFHPRHFEFLEAEGEELALGDGERTPALSRLLRRRGAPLTPDLLAAEQLRLERRGDDAELERRREELAADLGLLERRGLEVVVPSFAGERLVGAIALGAKRSETAFAGDELDMLQIVAGQVGVQLENTRLYLEAIERQRLQEELDMARDIQRRLLPRELPKVDGLEIAALNLASSQVSGDYYDFVRVGDSLGVVISDVSGKGLPASLLASNLQASIRALAISRGQPGEILTAVNSSLYESTDPDRYATLFLCCLEPEGGRIVYSNAGHNPPLLRRASGEIEWLSEGMTPLGAFPGMDYPEGTTELRPGDLLVLYTDGVTETEDAEGEFFGEEGLQAAVERLHARPAEEMVSGLRAAVFSHSAKGLADDDMTLIVLRATGPAPAATPEEAGP